MRILVLSGSPKPEHSDTLHITRAFPEGMNEADRQDIHIIHETIQPKIGLLQVNDRDRRELR